MGPEDSLTFLIKIVSPLAPHPQQSAYSAELNISKVFVKNPGTDVIVPLLVSTGLQEVGGNDLGASSPDSQGHRRSDELGYHRRCDALSCETRPAGALVSVVCQSPLPGLATASCVAASPAALLSLLFVGHPAALSRRVTNGRRTGTFGLVNLLYGTYNTCNTCVTSQSVDTFQSFDTFLEAVRMCARCVLFLRLL
jgi:hypothetical protein